MTGFEVDRGSALLAGERHGERGALVVLLHAGVTDARGWRGVAEPLAEAGRRVLAYDRRGFGATRVREAGPFSHVDDLLAVIDAVGDGAPAWLVGNSQGGRVALDCALGHPERVSGLVLVASAVSGAPELAMADAAERAVEAEYDGAWEAGDLELLNRVETRVWLDGPREREGRVAGEPRERMLAMNAVALAAEDSVGEEEATPDTWSRAGEIGCPALVVSCEHDFAAAAEQSRALAARLGDGRWVEMSGVAHLPALEAPARLAELIDDFVP